MFPNPQSALPLPPQPNLERYKKIAKSLVKACRSGQPEAIRDWTKRWVEDVVKLSGLKISQHLPMRVSEWVDQVEEFARRKLIGNDGAEADCSLSSAQFVIARAHGFESWQKFSVHIEELGRVNSAVSTFEAAADAIVGGDIEKLQRLLRENPQLVRARSTREHSATLLHYASANGVEGYRQRTPANIVEITDLLLQAGSDVDATAAVYGGQCTTLLLTATSVHPERAGVQDALLRTLLVRGAKIDDPRAGQSIVLACLANGRIRAAEFLATAGARLGFVEAAGLGRLDEVTAGFTHESSPNCAADQRRQGFLYACEFGRNEVVEFLIGTGLDLGTPDTHGQTGLHMAVIGGHLDTVRLLLKHHPPLEAKNEYGGTVVGQTLWSAAHDGDPDVYIKILQALVNAGATLPARHAPINTKLDEWLDWHGSRAETAFD